jgi:endonuclease YncB( thermonuclease family)
MIIGKCSVCHIKNNIHMRVFTLHVECYKYDKYGRVLVTITLEGVNVGDVMIEKGYAKFYDGRKKEKWVV